MPFTQRLSDLLPAVLPSEAATIIFCSKPLALVLAVAARKLAVASFLAVPLLRDTWPLAP